VDLDQKNPQKIVNFFSKDSEQKQNYLESSVALFSNGTPRVNSTPEHASPVRSSP